MPVKEPGPLFGTAEQAEPKVWAAGLLPIEELPPPAVPELLLLPDPQAARPTVALIAIAAIPERRSVEFMGGASLNVVHQLSEADPLLDPEGLSWSGSLPTLPWMGG
jgi:hypothetical protein